MSIYIDFWLPFNLGWGNIMQGIVKKNVKTRKRMMRRMTMTTKMATLMVVQCRRPLRRCCCVFCCLECFDSFVTNMNHVWCQIFFSQVLLVLFTAVYWFYRACRQLQPCVWVLEVSQTLLMHRAWPIFLVCTFSVCIFGYHIFMRSMFSLTLSA